MNNKECAHLWANRSRPAAKGSHFYFEGDTIYSYGPHFPIARLFQHKNGPLSFLMTTWGYSPTTAKHKSIVRMAASHLTGHLVPDVLADVSAPAKLRAVLKAAEKHAKELAEAAKKLKSDRAKAQRARKKLDAEILAAYPAELEAWRNGGKAPRLASRHSTATALRLVGDQVETSKGAKVPASVARKVWPILLAAVEKETASPSPFAWKPFFQREEFNWGDYRGISLHRIARGSPVELVVGCHQIPWSEVEIMAATLGLKN
jgi:hypothetical protein